MAASGPDPAPQKPTERRAVHLDFEALASVPNLPEPRRSIESEPLRPMTPRDRTFRVVERVVGHLAPTLWLALLVTLLGVLTVVAIALFVGLLPAAGATVVLTWMALAHRN